MFLSDEELKTDAFSREANLDRNIFIEEGKLNVRLILAHFIETVPLAQEGQCSLGGLVRLGQHGLGGLPAKGVPFRHLQYALHRS